MYTYIYIYLYDYTQRMQTMILYDDYDLIQFDMI